MYIHIGGYKTGSTSIQTFLRKNQQILKQNNFFVPYGELEYHHLLPLSLLHTFAAKSAFFPSMPEPARPLEYWWDLFESQIKQSHCDHIIISSENFCDFVHPDVEKSQQDIKRFIKKRFSPYKVYIVYYIRELNSYLHSWYNELVKAGVEKDNYQTFLTNNINANIFHIFQYQVLDFYADIFGKESLIIKKFPASSHSNVITDFLSTLNCDTISNKLSNNIFENNKLDEDFLFHKLLFNQFDFYDRDFNRNIAEILNRAKKNTKPSIDSSVFETLRNVKKTLKEKYDIDFTEDKKEDLLYYNINANEIFLATILTAVLKENRTIRAELLTIKNMLNQLITTNNR